MSDRTFEYLLNAMERAADTLNPSEHDYAAKRKAVFAYVEAARRDAERYRTVRDSGEFAVYIIDSGDDGTGVKEVELHTPADIDLAVDESRSALGADQPKGE